MKGLGKSPIKVIIFDLDGTVLSNEDEYEIAFERVFYRLNAGKKKNFSHETGIGVRENWERLLREYKIKTKKSADELAYETQLEYLKLLEKVRLRSGFKKFAELLREDGIGIALATSNSWSMVEKVFERFDIEKYFDFVTTAEEVHLNKPSPEIYLLTAEKFGVDPAECVVFEDSPAGVMAAGNAGMRVIGILGGGGNKEQLKKADLIIKSYLQILEYKFPRNGEIKKG